MIISFILGVLLIGIVTFGGGAVFIPMFENLYVTNMHLFNAEEFSTMVAVVNAIPGVTGPKLAAYGGYVVFGPIGFIIGLLVITIPSVIFMHLAYRKVNQMKDSKRLKAITLYIKPVIIAIFISMIYKFLKTSLSNLFSIEVILIFIISYYLMEKKKIDIVYIIIMGITYGIVSYFIF